MIKVKFQTSSEEFTAGLSCSNCGDVMCNDYDSGWFNKKLSKDGYSMLVKPNFNFCPYCGKPVYQGYVKEVKEYE